MDQKLGELLVQMQQAIEQQAPAEEESAVQEPDEEGLGPDDEQRIEQLFEQAKQDRASAYELKRELDRLGVFKEYEDRFLDLFKKAGVICFVRFADNVRQFGKDDLPHRQLDGRA